MGEVLEDAAPISGDLAELRRAIHAEPEIGLDLPRTQEKVLAALDGLPLEISRGAGAHSVTAVLRGGRPGGTVLLRGDMDALPVTERTGLPYASRIDGVMHACGHDLHTAMLAGAARLLSARRAELAGNVIFMFQPGEETAGGAELMIAEGVLDAAGDRPVAAFALHVASGLLPLGMFASRDGTMMAAADTLEVTVHGPRRARVAAAPGRRPDPGRLRDRDRAADAGHPAVRRVRPGRDHGGQLPRGHREQRDPRRGAARRHRCGRSRPGRGPRMHGRRAPPGAGRRVGARAVGHGRVRRRLPGDGQRRRRGDVRRAASWPTCSAAQRFVRTPDPITGSEDFSFVLDQVPGAFLMLGACPPGRRPGHGAVQPLGRGGLRRRRAGRRRGPAGRAGPAQAGETG